MIHRATFVTVTAGRARAARNARLLKRLFRARAAPTTAASGFLANAISETDASPSREIAKGIRDAADLLGARRGACGSTPRRARDAARRRVCLQTFFSDVQERFEGGRAIPAIDLVRAAFGRVDLPVGAMVPLEAPRIGAAFGDVEGQAVEVAPQFTANARERNLLGRPPSRSRPHARRFAVRTPTNRTLFRGTEGAPGRPSTRAGRTAMQPSFTRSAGFRVNVESNSFAGLSRGCA